MTEDGTVKLYARFDEPVYVIYHDGKGNVITSEKHAKGDAVTIREDAPLFDIGSLTKANVGWNTEEDGSGTTYDQENSTVTVTDHLNLYPVLKDGHWISYDTDGGSQMTKQFVLEGETGKKPEDPKRAGYSFQGWVTQSGESYGFDVPVTEDIMLKAQWKAEIVGYTILFWTENADDEGYTYDSSFRVTDEGTTGEHPLGDGTAIRAFADTRFKQSGYTFYFRNEEKTREEIEKTILKGDGSSVLNVYYDRVYYNLKLNGTDYQVDHVKYGQHIREILKSEEGFKDSYQPFWEYTLTYNGIYNEVAWPKPYERDEKMETPQYMASYYGSEIPNGATLIVKPRSYYGPYSYDGIDLYGETMASALANENNPDAEPLEYELRTSGIKSVNDNPDVTEDIVLSEGFRFHHMENADFEGGVYHYLPRGKKEYKKGSMRQYGKRNHYTITFNEVGGPTAASLSILYEFDLSGYAAKYQAKDGTSAEYEIGVTKKVENGAEYIFEGWYENIVYAGDPFVFEGTMPARNIQLYAKWKPVVYQVTFLGWTLNQQPYHFQAPVTKDITLVAQYAGDTTFRVLYEAGEGTGTVEDGANYLNGAWAIILADTGLTPPEGKHFTGWMGSDGTLYRPGSAVLIEESDATLTAQWDAAPEMTSLIYDRNYSYFGIDPAPLAQEDDVVSEPELWNNETLTLRSITAAEDPKGYDFGGWYLTENCEGDALTEVLVDSASSASGARRLRLRAAANSSAGENKVYAKWIKRNPHLTVTKTTVSEPQEEKGYKVGETIAYEIAVTNDGNLALKDIVVTDELTGDTFEAGSLEPGETSVTFRASHTVTEEDVAAGTVVNVATATGKVQEPEDPQNPEEPEVTPGRTEDDTEDDTEDMIAELQVEKTITGTPANGEAYVLGEEICYSVTVRNKGNVTVKEIQVTDELTGKTGADAVEIAELAPNGEQTVSVGIYKVTVTDVVAGKVTNAATAAGKDPNGDEVVSEPGKVDAGTGKIKITAVASQVETTYDGQEYSAAVSISDLPDGYTGTGSSPEKVKNYTKTPVTATVGEVLILDSDGNDVTAAFAIECVDGSITIHKKPMTIVTASAEKPYDGTPLTQKEADVTGLEGEDQIVVDVTGSQTQAGSAENTCTYQFAEGDAENYEITVVLGTLKVTDAEESESNQTEPDETDKKGEPDKTDETNKTVQKSEPEKQTAVKTGDDTPQGALWCLWMISGVLIVLLLGRRRLANRK